MRSPTSIFGILLGALLVVASGAGCGPAVIGRFPAGDAGGAAGSDSGARDRVGSDVVDAAEYAAAGSDARRDAGADAHRDVLSDAHRDAVADLHRDAAGADRDVGANTGGDASSDGAGDAASGSDGGLPPVKIVQVVTGTVSTCARSDTGRVRCWGMSSLGELGLGNTSTIGDDELPDTAGDVPLPRPAILLASGGHHTCAILDDGSVTCWGWNLYGELGTGDTQNIGDQSPAGAAAVDLGGKAIQIVAGFHHTCALLEGNHLRCWGLGQSGQLGYPTTDNIGDDETPASAGDVDVGGTVVDLAAGYYHTCALLADAGRVRCWGANESGQLGYGNTQPVFLASAGGDVPIGYPALQISAGLDHTCAVLDPAGTVRCWGSGSEGQLGYGNTSFYGDNEPADQAPPPLVFASAIVELAAGGFRTCARESAGMVDCWGTGVLGNGSATPIGDDEVATSGNAYVSLGAPAAAVSSAHWHSCALTTEGTVRCWGLGQVSTLAPVGGGSGWLGYGNALDIPDPSRAGAGDVHVFQ